MRVLDLRTLADEWNDELVDLAEGRGPDGLEGPSYGEMADRVGKYEALCSELGLTPADPDTLLWHANQYEPTLIHEDDFEEYAEELAQDIGAISSDQRSNWPLDCIDWERAARELQMDYTAVEYDGDTYLMRS